MELGDIDDLDDDLSNLQLRPTARNTAKAADSRPITQQQAIVRFYRTFYILFEDPSEISKLKDFFVCSDLPKDISMKYSL